MATLAETVVCIVLITIILLFVLPSLCYYLRIYYLHRSNPMIYKRHYQVMIIFNILLMISLVGDKALYILSIILTDDLQEIHKNMIHEISECFYFFAGPSIVLAMDISVWLYFYDTTWTTITNPGNKWTYFIDPQYDDNQTDLFINNWFIKNQSKYGNIKWITKHIAIPVSILVYSSLFLSLLINPHFNYFIFMGWMGIMALFISIIYCNVPKNQIEILKIKKQWDRLIKLSLSFVIFFAVYIVLKLFVIPPQHQFALILPFQYVFTLHYFIGGMLSTRYVLIETGLLKTKPLSSDFMQIGNVLNISPVVSRDEDEDTNIDDAMNAIVSLSKILRNKLSFNAFMSHILKEFSSENLMAILECWQYKEMIKNTNSRKNGQNELMLNVGLIQYELPPHDVLPRSVIVYNEKDTLQDKAIKLIQKYVYSINGNCLFEVNISSGCKYKLIKKSMQLKDSRDFDGDESKLRLQELYDLFDEMILELIRLLNDSHLRFVHTEDYKQLILHNAI